MNADGTYELPDPNLSVVWKSEDGGTVLWVGPNWYSGTGYRTIPSKSRWMPWTPPTFPVREKCSIRLCIATAPNGRKMVSWYEQYLATDGIPFRDGENSWWRQEELSDIVWLTPEYKDELPKETK